ncbi:MAG: hypothetical protein KKC50_08370 [Candidatus Omnitrophica bacterium]|nr:hypothetical protein [Candidatus Omnitrophota bacterium]MBU1008445.1 hypothetical protein [Candidatus Dependentiae bacterium]
MPTNESAVGGFLQPIPAGTLNSELVDPTVRGILDYLAFWLTWGMNAKMGNMQGRSPTILAPAAVFPYDPNAIYVRQSLPALYVWCAREYEEQVTLLRHCRRRDIFAQYIFQELVSPQGMTAREGLLGNVAAIFARAITWGRHYDYGYNGDPPGTPIARSVGMMAWRYRNSEYGMSWKHPGTTEGVPERMGTGGDGAVQWGYPTCKTHIEVWERIDVDRPIDLPNVPNDLMPDIQMTMETGDTTESTTPVRSGVLPYPDGSEDDEVD